MLVNLGCKLSEQEAKALALIYLPLESLDTITTGTQTMEKITKRDKIRNCRRDLELLKESLVKIGRNDLIGTVESYIENNALPLDAVSSTTPGLHPGTEEEESDITNSAVTGVVKG